MQVLEFSKGAGAALGLVFTPDTSDAFAHEWPQAVVAVRDWRAKHVSRCEAIMLTVVSAPEHHSAIVSLIERTYRDEAELAPLIQGVGVRVALIDPKGKPVKEYTLGTSPQANRRPWWKFW